MLYPGDAICSYKPILGWWKPWVWPEVFFNMCLLLKQWFVYVFPKLIKFNFKALWNWIKCNHVRIYIGYIFVNEKFKAKYPELYEKLKPCRDQFDGVHVGFHWTSPRAEFVVWEAWMTDPKYARIYRHVDSENSPVPPLTVLEACLPYDGMIYDYGQLVDMALGISNLFDFGKEHKVCSVGVRIVMDVIFFDNVIPNLDPETTLPCSFGYTPRLKRAFD